MFELLFWFYIFGSIVSIVIMVVELQFQHKRHDRFIEVIAVILCSFLSWVFIYVYSKQRLKALF